jgi:hypothetical protein
MTTILFATIIAVSPLCILTLVLAGLHSGLKSVF